VVQRNPRPSPQSASRISFDLAKVERDDDLQQWRRFVAEYRTLEGYIEFHREATRQRINSTKARGSGENDNNKAHKEYLKHMFPDGDPETLLAAQVALQKKTSSLPGDGQSG